MQASVLACIFILCALKNIYFVVFFTVFPYKWKKNYKFAKLFVKRLNIFCIYIQTIEENRLAVDFSMC